MDEVIAANGGAVTVTGDDHHIQIRTGELDARGKGNGPAMGSVDGVKIHIAGSPGRAADAGHNHCVVLGQPLLLNGLDNGLHDNAVAAAGAPQVRQAVLAEIFLIASRKFCHHALPPSTSITIFSISASISTGSKDFILYLPQRTTGQAPWAARRTSCTTWP